MHSDQFSAGWEICLVGTDVVLRQESEETWVVDIDDGSRFFLNLLNLSSEVKLV